MSIISRSSRPCLGRVQACLWRAVLFAVWVVAGSGCRSTDAMRQRCLAGETADCEKTCEKGIAGEGGCFHAAEQHRARAALDPGSKELERATAFFVKSCGGKHADGCLFAAQMIEMPFAPPSDDAEVEQDAMPPLIGDAEVLTREQRLAEACALGSGAGCRRLGDVLVAKNTERALEAYGKYCATTTAAADCLGALSANARLFDAVSTSCKAGAGDACTKLGALLYAVDPPRALRLFASECELRGVAKLVGTAGRFVRLRASQARRGTLLPEPEQGAAPTAPRFDVRVEAVNGKRALVEVERALARRAPELSRCGSAGAAGKIRLHLDVDLTGDVFRAQPLEAPPAASALPVAVGTCVARSLEQVVVGPPGAELVTVDVEVATSAAPDPAQR